MNNVEYNTFIKRMLNHKKLLEQYMKIGKVGDQIGRFYDYTMNNIKK